MNNVVKFLIDRLSEKSTIVTIVTLVAGAAGAHFSPENTNAIATAVVSVVAAIAMFVGADKHPDA